MDNDYDQKLDAAIKQNEEEYSTHAHHEGNYLSPLWNFARLVASLPPYSELSAEQAASMLDSFFVRKGYANPDDGWEQEFASVVEDGDACRMFLDAWEQIRFGYGETLLGTILARTESGELLEQLLELPLHVLRGKKYRKFIAYAAEFQRRVGPDQPILLPLRCTATSLHLDDETVSVYRRAAMNDGLLQEVEPYHPKRSATKFKFNLHRLEEILRANEAVDDALAEQKDTSDDLPW